MVDQFEVSVTQFANIFGNMSGNQSINRLLEPYLKEIDTEIYHTKRDQIVFLLNTYHTNLKHLRFIVQTIIDTHNQSRWIDKIDLINDCLNQFGLRINHVEPTTNTIEIIGESEIDCRQMNEKSANLTRERTSKIIRENQFPQIFVSHSQDDENLKGYFNKIFASSPVKAVYEEYEQLISGDVTVEKIKQDIDTSNAVFVLLSENVERKPHTRDWIAFEAGYASGKRKEVWVFEPAYNLENYLLLRQVCLITFQFILMTIIFLISVV